MSTDFDSWSNKEPVTFNEILRVMNENADKVKNLLIETIPHIKNEECICKNKINETIIQQ